MVKHLCLEIIKQQQIPPLHRELVKAVTSSKRSESLQQRSIPLAKYDGARLSLRHFKSEKKIGRGSERIPITYAIVTATSKVRLKLWCCRLFSIHGYLALILFTVTIPFQRQDVVNHSELRYLKHLYHLLCLGLVKPLLGRSFSRSWYMRLFHTPRTSFLLTTRL